MTPLVHELLSIPLAVLAVLLLVWLADGGPRALWRSLRGK